MFSVIVGSTDSFLQAIQDIENVLKEAWALDLS